MFLTNSSLKDNNGVYHFHRGFLKLAKAQNWKVDILFDKLSGNKGDKVYQDLIDIGATCIFPKRPVIDNNEKYFSFTVGLSATELANLQTCVLEAMQTNLYDFAIGCPLYTNQITKLLTLDIPTIWYTHAPDSVTGIYNDGYSDPMVDNLIEMQSSLFTIATQTDENVKILNARGKDAICLPLPFPDLEVFDTLSLPKNGIMFIGSTEGRKNVDAFIKLIDATKIHAKVLTSRGSADAIREKLLTTGATFEIQSNVSGNVKRDLFASSEIFFMPSLNESYGYAFAEAISQTHAVAFDYAWTKNFSTDYCHIVDKTSYIEYIEKLYYAKTPIKKDATAYVRSLHTDAETRWSNFINASKPVSTEKFTKSFIDKHRNFYIHDLAVAINRPHLSLDELRPLIARAKSGQAHITYMDDYTWFSLDNLQPTEILPKNTFSNLFG